MTIATANRNLISELESVRPADSKSEPAASKAWERFRQTGLPGQKSEEYKYAPIARQLEKLPALKPAAGDVLLPTPLPQFLSGQTCNYIVFVDGRFSSANLAEKEVKVTTRSMEESSDANDPFEWLNTAFSPALTIITVAEGVSLQHPIAIVYHSSGRGTLVNPRWTLQLLKGSKATVIEMCQPHAYELFQNKKSVIQAEDKSSLEYLILQDGTPAQTEVNHTEVRCAPSSYASCLTLSLNCRFVRNNMKLVVDGSQVEAHLYGLYLPSGDSLIDNHTVVDHRQPESFSNELYKGVMNDRSKGVFNGKIYVRPQAQKTNAFQSNRNILLSENASVNTKPQLEIWADDVKCSHGCTTGQLDEEALFYLRSRGIDKRSAYAMLLHAFVAETFTEMKMAQWKETIDGLVTSRLLKV